MIRALEALAADDFHRRIVPRRAGTPRLRERPTSRDGNLLVPALVSRSVNRTAFLSNAILWAAAILASALAGAPPFVSTVLLPSLAAGALLATRPARAGARCAP